MNPAVRHSAVATRDGDRLSPRPPMATRCEPSQRALSRARLSAQHQRELRERRELANVLDSLEWEPRRYVPPDAPPAPRKTESTTGPDPLLTAAFVAGVIAGATAAALFLVKS